MTRPSDQTEALCQHLTDDLMRLRTAHLEPIQGATDEHDLEDVKGHADAAEAIVVEMLDRIQAFDHSFGRDAEGDGDG